MEIGNKISFEVREHDGPLKGKGIIKEKQYGSVIIVITDVIIGDPLLKNEELRIFFDEIKLIHHPEENKYKPRKLKTK